MYIGNSEILSEYQTGFVQPYTIASMNELKNSIQKQYTDNRRGFPSKVHIVNDINAMLKIQSLQLKTGIQ